MTTTPSTEHLVKHRDGWCISSQGFFSPDDDAVATLCGQVVILPFGYRRGAADCPDCLARRAIGAAHPTLQV